MHTRNRKAWCPIDDCTRSHFFQMARPFASMSELERHMNQYHPAIPVSTWKQMVNFSAGTATTSHSLVESGRESWTLDSGRASSQIAASPIVATPSYSSDSLGDQTDMSNTFFPDGNIFGFLSTPSKTITHTFSNAENLYSLLDNSSCVLPSSAPRQDPLRHYPTMSNRGLFGGLIRHPEGSIGDYGVVGEETLNADKNEWSSALERRDSVWGGDLDDSEARDAFGQIL
jgi:hypothetical protein